MQSFLKLALLALAGCRAPVVEAPAVHGRRPAVVPQYTQGGELLRPVGYESWVFAGASLGLSYSEGLRHEGPGEFHNVFLEPTAFEQYQRTGHFPDKTMLVLALHEPKQRESIQKQGYFEGNLIALEAAVKDQERFKETWAYFDFGKEGASALAKPPEACHSCHAQHGADDNVFVQFYPPLRAVWEARREAHAEKR